MTAAATRLPARMSDTDLEREIARCERLVDRLADACWPAAHLQRAQVIELLEELEAEVQRRRT